ncbi:MAG: hypothetical protein ACLTRS_05915 [Lachnospiraceae bacterium]
MLFSYDKTLGTVETSQGTMTLDEGIHSVFLEMLLMNFMQMAGQYLYALLFFDNAALPPWARAASVFQHDLYFLLRHWNWCLH